MTRAITMAGLIGLTLAGCNRNAVPLTACNGTRPAVERVLDAAPPNCAQALPGEVAPAG